MSHELLLVSKLADCPAAEGLAARRRRAAAPRGLAGLASDTLGVQL